MEGSLYQYTNKPVMAHWLKSSNSRARKENGIPALHNMKFCGTDGSPASAKEGVGSA